MLRSPFRLFRMLLARSAGGLLWHAAEALSIRLGLRRKSRRASRQRVPWTRVDPPPWIQSWTLWSPARCAGAYPALSLNLLGAGWEAETHAFE